MCYRQGWLLGFLAFTIGCAQDSNIPKDEARLRYPNEDYSSPEAWKVAAQKYYPPASHDYFADMDRIGKTATPGATKLELTADEIKGRNAWVLWTGGNEAFWDWLARHSYGSVDFLKLIDTEAAPERFARTGLVNEPGMRLPDPEETANTYGIRYARPGTVKRQTGAGEIHVEYRQDRLAGIEDHERIYGYPSGIVGLRLYPNPEFTAEAKARWDPNRYYSDAAYASRPDTIRPYRVGMSCAFCHIAPHPLNPPTDAEKPKWENLSNNIGNQYLRFRASFGNLLKPNNYLYHVLDAQLPGALDTSLVPSDNINNPNTINSFFGLRGRVERATHNPRETVGADTLAYLRTYVEPGFTNPHLVPRVLLDGSDSVGVHVALSRVYLNIGTHHQQWVRLHNPLLGFREQAPFKLKEIAENSLYWHATQLRIEPMAAFFLRSTDPMRLKDAPLTPDQRGAHLRGDGLPWHPEYDKGRKVFAKGCIACHSSIHPGDLPELEAKVQLPNEEPLPAAWDKLDAATKARFIASRQKLRLRPEDLSRLTRGDGLLPPAYELWAQEAVKHREFWEHAVKQPDNTEVVVHNYLSTDARLPVNLIGTNSARAVATNALHGNLWEDYASQTYKELDAIGSIRYRDPISGAAKSYAPPGGGPGYYRVPTLISIWATAPFFHNNALGTFNNDPSVEGRLKAFDDAIHRLLSPEKRRVPSKQHVWESDQGPKSVFDGWYHGKRRQKSSEALSDSAAQQAAAQLDVDDGWVWRTTEDSSFWIEGHHLPTFVAGLTGWSTFWLSLLPWLPSLGLVLLGIALLLSSRLISYRERLEREVPWIGWLAMPLRWVIAIVGLGLTGVAIYLVVEYWTTIMLLDIVTNRSITLLRLQAVAIPVIFLLFTVLLFSLHRLPEGGFRLRLTQFSGAVCLVFAILVALTFGRFLSGRGGDIAFGPIPEGVPVNLIANMDPKAPPELRRAALRALGDFVLEYEQADDAQKKLWKEKPELFRQKFEERVAPVLLRASKCPDLVTDRGHDYEFIRRLSDEEKRDLTLLLKTF